MFAIHGARHYYELCVVGNTAHIHSLSRHTQRNCYKVLTTSSTSTTTSRTQTNNTASNNIYIQHTHTYTSEFAFATKSSHRLSRWSLSVGRSRTRHDICTFCYQFPIVADAQRVGLPCNSAAASAAAAAAVQLQLQQSQSNRALFPLPLPGAHTHAYSPTITQLKSPPANTSTYASLRVAAPE